MSQAPSGFNPDLFLAAESKEVNVKRPPLPEADYSALISDVKMAGGIIDKPGDNYGKPWLQAIVTLKVQVSQEAQAALGLQLKDGTITLTDRPFINLTDGGTIDNAVGKNARQKMYREALDLNKPGDVWAWAKAIGQPVKVKVKHEMYQGEIQERVGLILRP